MLVLSKGFYLGMRIKTAAAVRAIAKAKQLVFDFISPFAHEYYFVQNFVVVDQRVDKDALVHVLLNILGSSDEQRNEAITTYLRGLVSGSVTHRVSDSRSYEGKGMSAVVGGVEFSVGTEGFLIDRGVYLQASELVAASDNQLALYVAMRDELVAYLTLERKALADAGAFQSKLRAAGLKCVLCSVESPDKVDVVGKKLGLDLAYVHGDMSPERYIEKLRGDVASVFVIDPKTDPVLSKEAAVTVSFFDEFRWDIDRADVVLMREDLHGIVTLIDLVKRFKMTQNLLLMLPVFALLVPAFSMLWTPASPGIFVLALVLPLAVAYLALPKLLEPQA
jgi:cation transport ATPase